ncbi:MULTISPECIES: hypothetical protein [Salinibaculum]|uniref:hypothetical protein n=1 Tax=Salinibaculum TaxID=2732368 RepID=UPI0030CF3563
MSDTHGESRTIEGDDIPEGGVVLQSGAVLGPDGDLLGYLDPDEHRDDAVLQDEIPEEAEGCE